MYILGISAFYHDSAACLMMVRLLPQRKKNVLQELNMMQIFQLTPSPTV